MTASGEIPTIAEAARRIKAKTLSPVELVRACLDRIHRHEPKINAFITLTEEAALAAARAAEQEIMARGPRGPLHGIPIGLKDIFKTKGLRTTAHSRQLQDHVPNEDACSVERLAAAGAISLGKLATHEFAIGGPSFDLPWPPARNPWNPDHFTGGSSSGTGAAIAAGMVLGGMGSDTSGSIRGPAGFCGIAGIKPSYGRVSRHGVFPLAFSMDHAGPMAWNAEDCAIMLQAIAGYDPRDPASADRPVPDYSAGIGQGVRGIRIGVVRHFFETDGPVDAEQGRAINGALDVLRRLGAEVRDVKLSPLDDWHATGTLILFAEAFAVHETLLKTHPDRYGELARSRIMLGAFITASDYIQALRRRAELVAEMDALMATTDILVNANQMSAAARIEAVTKWRLFTTPSYNVPFNLTGQPAISICCGFSESGLPLSLQLAARRFEEPLLLRVAHSYEQATEWHKRRPPMTT